MFDPRTTRIEENGVTFPLLTLDQCEQVDREVRKTLIENACAIADACGLAGANKFGSVNAVVPSEIDLQNLYDFAFSARGQRFILMLSLGASLPKERAAEVVNGYRGYDGFNLAMAVYGQMTRLSAAEVAEEMAKRARDAANLGEKKSTTNPPNGDATNTTGAPPASE